LTNGCWNLSQDKVRRISRVIEILSQSAFDNLPLEIGNLRLTCSRL
jgi:hypothetical protein